MAEKRNKQVGELRALVALGNGGGSGGITQLTTDVHAGPGSGSVAATVVGLQGYPVASTAPASANVLTWNGSAWTPEAPSGGGGLDQLTADVLAGPGTGSQAATVVALQGHPVAATAPTTNYVLTWNGSAWAPEPAASGGGITQLTGDVLAGPGTGSQAAAIHSIQTVPVAASSPVSGNPFVYNGASWVPLNTSLAVSGGNLTVTQVGNITLTANTGGSINLTAASNIAITSSGGNATVSGDGNAQLSAVTGQAQVISQSGGNGVVIESLNSGNISLTATSATIALSGNTGVTVAGGTGGTAVTTTSGTALTVTGAATTTAAAISTSGAATALTVATSTVSSAAFAQTITNSGGKGASGLLIVAGDPANTAGDTFIAFETTAASVRGAITQTTGGVQYGTLSDETFKKDITPHTGALATVLGIETFSFAWKDTTDAGRDVGYVAQRLQAQLPRVVTPGVTQTVRIRDQEGKDTGKTRERKIPWQVNVQGMVPYLHGALKEFVQETRAALTAAHAQLATANAKIAALEAAVPAPTVPAPAAPAAPAAPK